MAAFADVINESLKRVSGDLKPLYIRAVGKTASDIVYPETILSNLRK